MRLYTSLILLTLLALEAMCYHYESGLGFRRKRSPRYPNYEDGTTGGNNIPNFGGGQNGGNNRPNYGGGSFPNFGGGGGGGNFNMFGGGGFPNFNEGFPSFDNTNWFPKGASAEGRGALEGVDAVIAEAEQGDTRASGLRVGRGRIMGYGKSRARDS